jgi:hypothetical protein
MSTSHPSPRLKMSLTTTVLLAVPFVWFAATLLFATVETAEVQLFDMALALLVLVALGVAFVRVFLCWKRESWRTLIIFLVTPLLVIFMPDAVGYLRIAAFKRALPQYEAAVQRIASGEIAVSEKRKRIEELEGPLAYGVFAQRSPAGVLTVEFWTGGGFPVKHRGYLYSSSGAIEQNSPAAETWPKRRAVVSQWFRVAD